VSTKWELKIINYKFQIDPEPAKRSDQPRNSDNLQFSIYNLRFSIFLLTAALLAGTCFGCSLRPNSDVPDDHLYPINDFSLTERSGATVRKSDLLGKVWVAAFIFTRCTGPCSQVSGTMARLQQDFADYDDVTLVSFSVDPEYDTPEVLSQYAKNYRADPKRWLFLTGKPDEVYGLIRDGFRLTAQPNQGADRTPGNEIMHDTRVAVVDRSGEIRGYFQATEAEDIAKLEQKIKTIVREKP
jgi:cytochrome oxidase Cu insertion factor (SCO1/SenC/PrrC family)